MIEPLNQEVAERYGYNEEPFRVWTKTYVDSLKLDTLKFKPMNNKYVLYAKGEQGAFNKYLYLDEGYIYLLKSDDKKVGEDIKTHYIPVREPFYHQINGRGLPMNGLYVERGGRHAYTSQAFNSFKYTIIGVAPFPIIVANRFLNWNSNPLP